MREQDEPGPLLLEIIVDSPVFHFHILLWKNARKKLDSRIAYPPTGYKKIEKNTTKAGPSPTGDSPAIHAILNNGEERSCLQLGAGGDQSLAVLVALVLLRSS